MGGSSAQSGGKITRWGAVITIIKCNWGIGMMAMPFMLHSAGPISGVLMFLVSMALTQFSIVNVVRVKASLESRPRVELLPHEATPRESDHAAHSPLLRRHREAINASPSSPDGDKHNPRGVELDFTAIMSETFGWIGEWAAMFAIFVASYGSCVAYLKFIHDNMIRFFPELLPHPDLWVWLPCIVLCGLAWPDSVGFLAPFSLMGLVASFSFACLVLYHACNSMSPSTFGHHIVDDGIFHPTTFPLALSIAAFCNEGIVVLTPSTQSAMINPEHYLWTSFWGIVYFTVCYMAVGLAGVALFYGNILGDMSLNFETHHPIYSAAAVLYSVQLVPTYAVVFFVAYESLEGKFSRAIGGTRDLHLSRRPAKLVFFFNRCLWIAISGFLALQVPHFGDFLGLIGALGTSLAVYILPQVAYLKLFPAKMQTSSSNASIRLDRLWRMGCYLLTLFGAALAIGGTYQSAQLMFGNSATTTTTTTTTHHPQVVHG